MLNKDEIARRRALHPQEWSAVDSWAKYIATQELQVLKDEIATNPECDVAKKVAWLAFGDRDLRVLEMLEQVGYSFHETDDVWAVDSHLCQAIEYGRDCPGVVKWLLDRGASPVRSTMNHWTPLHLAAIRNYTDVMAVLLERGVPVDIGTEIDGNWTPLMEACRAGASESVALLLKHRADATRCCRMIGDSVLEIATKRKHVEIIAMINAATRRR